MLIATVAWLIFNHWRKKIALNRLRHFEARNCGFINELPIVSMSCGSMSRKKTTLITDMVLSQEVMFRQKAFQILQTNDMKLPHFPWIMFEDELRACMEHGTVYNFGISVIATQSGSSMATISAGTAPRSTMRYGYSSSSTHWKRMRWRTSST